MFLQSSAEAVAVDGSGEVASGDVITSGDVETRLTIEGVADEHVQEGQDGEQGGAAAEQVSDGQRLSQTGDAGTGIASAAIAAAAIAGAGAVTMARRKQD